MTIPLVFAPIRDKLERAARNGERLHLDTEQVRALVTSPIYATLAELTAQEFASQWHDVPPAPAAKPATITATASSSGRSGSGGAPSAPNGASAGTMTVALSEAVERAERGQALSFLESMDNPRRKRSTP
ncbi:MAG: hypothetical protein ACTHOJ_14575 [Sphingomonas oligoaromativorans]